MHTGASGTHTRGTQRRSLPVDQLKCTEQDCVEGPSSPQCRITGTAPPPPEPYLDSQNGPMCKDTGSMPRHTKASLPWGPAWEHLPRGGTHTHTHTHIPHGPPRTRRDVDPYPGETWGGEEVSDTSTAAAPTLRRHIRKAPPPLLHRPQAETRGHTAQRPPPRHPGPPPPPATPSRVAHRPLPLTAPLSDTPSPPP